MAVDALVIINVRKVIGNGDCTDRAGHFAFFTADTGVLAGFAGIGALVLVAAHHHLGGLLGYHIDDALGAGADTQTAA